MSTLGATRITRLSLSLAASGSWRANVTLENGAPPSGRVTLTAGDLPLVGTVDPKLTGLDAPERPRVVVVGGAGWLQEPTSPISYEGPSVRLSTILRDLSARAGEPIEMPADVVIGKQWGLVRSTLATSDGAPNEPLRLRDALAALRRDRYIGTWRADPDGVTRFGPRIGTAITARATELSRNASVGVRVVGIDSVAAFLPGNTIDGEPILRTVITETPGSLTAELWTAPTSIRTALLRLVGETWPQLIYGHLRTYLVSSVGADGRIDCVPPTEAPHLPPLPKVDQWGLGGARATPLVGSRVVVAFRDASPARPVVVACEPLASSVPTLVEIDADTVKLGAGAATVLRVGDKIAIDPTPGPTLGTVSFIGTSVASHSRVDA